jgi:transcriptional regulator with XRE-family HTH domain
MGLIPYQISNEDIDKLTKFTEPGEIHKYIRLIAERVNPDQFKIKVLANKVGTTPSTISRFEKGHQHELKASLLTKISEAMCVPLEVFHLSYYMNHPQPFIICGDTPSFTNFELLLPSHRIQLSLKAYSPSGAIYEELDEVVELSVLEYEEFIDEVKSLIKKVRTRREVWNRKEKAVNKLNEWT